MDKMALADRFEGYSKVFASESPFGIDLKAMADTLRGMPEDKFATIIDASYEGDKEAVVAPMTQGPGALGMRTPHSERGHGRVPGGIVPTDPAFAGVPKGPKGKMLPETALSQIGKEHGVPSNKVKSIYESIAKAEEAAASAEVEACGKTASTDSTWTKEAFDFVAQNLVRDVVGMDKSICCDTKRHLTTDQIPDAKKKAETKGAVNREQDTGRALTPEQVPNLSVVLDSDIYKKSKGAVRKEAAVEETPDAATTEKQEIDSAKKDPLAEAQKTLKGTQKGIDKAKKEQDKAKKVEEKAQKSQLPTEEPAAEVEANSIVAEGIEFDNLMSEVDANDEDVKKLSALFE